MAFSILLVLIKSERNPDAKASPAPVLSITFDFGAEAEYKSWPSETSAPAFPLVIIIMPYI